MVFAKLLVSAFVWLFVTLYVYVAPLDPEVPGWVLSIGSAVMLAGWIAHGD